MNNITGILSLKWLQRSSFETNEFHPFEKKRKTHLTCTQKGKVIIEDCINYRIILDNVTEKEYIVCDNTVQNCPNPDLKKVMAGKQHSLETNSS